MYIHLFYAASFQDVKSPNKSEENDNESDKNEETKNKQESEGEESDKNEEKREGTNAKSKLQKLIEFLAR